MNAYYAYEKYYSHCMCIGIKIILISTNNIIEYTVDSPNNGHLELVHIAIGFCPLFGVCPLNLLGCICTVDQKCCYCILLSRLYESHAWMHLQKKEI